MAILWSDPPTSRLSAKYENILGRRERLYGALVFDLDSWRIQLDMIYLMCGGRSKDNGESEWLQVGALLVSEGSRWITLAIRMASVLSRSSLMKAKGKKKY